MKSITRLIFMSILFAISQKGFALGCLKDAKLGMVAMDGGTG